MIVRGVVADVSYAAELLYMLRRGAEVARQEGRPASRALREFAADLDELARSATAEAILRSRFPQSTTAGAPSPETAAPSKGDDHGLLTTRDAAEQLGLSERRVRQLAESRIIRARRSDRGYHGWLIDPADVAAYQGNVNDRTR